MHLGGVFVLDGRALRDERPGTPTRRDPSARRSHGSIESRRTSGASSRCRSDSTARCGSTIPTSTSTTTSQVISLDECITHDGVGGDVDHAFTLCADLNAERLDRSRPLWEIWLVDGLDDGRVVALLKIHHALTDGVGAVELIAALFDLDEHAEEPSRPADRHPRPRRAAPAAPSALRAIVDATVDHLRDPVELARSTAGTAMSTPATVAQRVATVSTGVRDLLGPDAVAPPSALNQPVGAYRVILPIDLDFDGIDTIREAHGGSANDVALTLITGGLRAWLIDAR